MFRKLTVLLAVLALSLAFAIPAMASTHSYGYDGGSAYYAGNGFRTIEVRPVSFNWGYARMAYVPVISWYAVLGHPEFYRDNRHDIVIYRHDLDNGRFHHYFIRVNNHFYRLYDYPYGF